MAERGKDKKCADCANWKVKDSQCTYYDDIVHGIIHKTDDACNDFYPKENQKSKIHKASGIAEQGYFESIYHKQKPAFLTINKGIFRIYSEVTAEGEIFQPKKFPSEFPYEAYGFFEGEVLCREDLFWKIRDEFNLFLDVESIWKDYLAGCVLLSYQQEKLRTVPYPYFVGYNESGKTVALNLLNWLCYRPMLGVTIPSADVYGYLDDSDAPGTILEDEAQGMQKDSDKAKIYKAGYKKGAVVPRTVMMQNKRFIKYFRVFGFKACAAEEIPRVKGLLERFIFIPMTEGIPNKDWADLNETDEQRLRELRNMLLKWRLACMDWKIPDIELPVKGRLKELWKPVIQIISGLTVEKDLRTHLELLQKERLNERINTLEGRLVKVVCELYVSGEPLAFADLWTDLIMELGGKLDNKKPHKVDTPEFGEITKQKIGYRLREVLGGKKIKARGQEGTERVYEFDFEKLKRIAKKYGCNFVPKFPTIMSLEECPTLKPEIKIEETRVLSENKPFQEILKTQKEANIPPDVVQLGNSGTEYTLEQLALHTKSITRLRMDFGINTCKLCKTKDRSEWQVTEFDDSWHFLCGSCGQKLSEKLNKNQ